MFKDLSLEEVYYIAGGNAWGDAVIGGLEGANVGVRLCAAYGPVVIAGCGLVGAGVVGWLSYHG